MQKFTVHKFSWVEQRTTMPARSSRSSSPAPPTAENSASAVGEAPLSRLISFALSSADASAARVVVTVRAGMPRAELEACLVYAFARRHRITSVVGVFACSEQAGPPPSSPLLPLAVLCAEPAALPDASCLLAIEPPFVPARRAGLLRPLCAVGAVLVAWAAARSGATTSLIMAPLRELFESRLRMLYRQGPQLNLGGVSIGFWEGAELHDICGRVTSHDATFWQKHPEECAAIYDKKVQSFVMLAEYTVLAVLAWKAVTRLLNVLLSPLSVLRSVAGAVHAKVCVSS